MKEKTLEIKIEMKRHSSPKTYVKSIANLTIMGVVITFCFIGLTSFLENFKPAAYRPLLVVLAVIWLKSRVTFKFKEDIKDQNDREKKMGISLFIFPLIVATFIMGLYYGSK